MRIRGVGLIAFAVALAACGGSSPQTSSSSQSPQQALLTAVHLASTTSLHLDISVTEVVRVNGPDAAKFTSLTTQPITIDGHFDTAGASETKGMFSVALAGRTEAIDVVVVNGTAYVSTNGGAYTTESVSQLSASENGVNSALQYLNAVGTVTDEGSTTSYGVSGEKYHATLDPTKLEQQLGPSFSSLVGQSSVNLSTALTIGGAALDAVVDSSGRLVSESGAFGAMLNLSALQSSLKGDTLSVSATFQAHFSDYGESVTVTPPPSS